MEGNKRFEKDLKWESFRLDIERMFGRERKSLEEIKAWLDDQGLHVTKNQLHYRLNKIWGLRSKAPRGHAHEFWQAARQLQTSETAESGSNWGSFVLENRQRLKPRDRARQIKRYNVETHSSNYRSDKVPINQSEKSFQLAIRSPTPERVEVPLSWPRDLPWLISSVQNLKITSDNPEDSPKTQLILRSDILGILGFPSHCLTNKWWRAHSVSSIASTLPELKAGDAKKRAQVMISVRSDDALAEQMKVVMQKVSNNFLEATIMDDRFLDRIEFVLDLVEQSGLWKQTLDLNGNDFTMNAVSDALFQGAFSFLFHIESRKDKLRYDGRRAYKILRWLLRSGQDPDTPIRRTLGMVTTGLQISLALGKTDLAMELVARQPRPGEFKYSNAFYATEPMNKCSLHPIILAISSPGPILAMLERCGLSLHGHTDLTSYRIDSYGDLWHPEVFPKLDPIPYILLTQETQFSTAVVQYLLDHVDENGASVYRIVVDWDAMFLYASGAGNLDVLRLLILRYGDFRGCDYTTTAEVINTPNEWGITALHAAVLARRNSLETFQFLLDQGAILDDSSELLHLACCFNSSEVVKFIHRRGMDINQRCRNRSRIWDSCNELCLDPSKKTPLELVLQVMSSLRHRLEIPKELFMVCKYLIANGSDVPWEILDMAITTPDTELLSAALQSATEVIDRYRKVSGNSPLSKALKSIRLGNKAKVAHISHLLLDAGAQVEAGDAVRAAFLGDWGLVTRILNADSNSVSKSTSQLEEHESVAGITLLESALLSGSRDVANEALDLEPEIYDVGALCAASLTTSSTGDYTIVRALIENRQKTKHLCQDQKHKEMTAIGIAAYKGDLELFQLLRRYLPWSNHAIVPRAVDLASAFEIDPPVRKRIRDYQVDKDRPLLRRFWNTGLIGSIQVFAVATATEIFDLFFNPGYPISSMALNRLIQLNLYDQIATLSRRGYQAEHIFSYAKTVSPLHAAVWQRDTAMIRACLDLGLDVNGFERNHRCLLGLGDQRFSCLTLSINQEDLETANLLLDKGGDVNSPPHPDHGMTPLQAACIRGHIGMVMKLLRLGADPDSPGASWGGRTALEGAAEHGRLDIVHLLLRAGVKTDGVGRKQYISAILFAQYQCHTQVQKLLENHRGWTEEDRALWDDPDLPYYTLSHPTTSADGFDGSDRFEQQQELEGEREEDETQLGYVQEELSLSMLNEIEHSEGTPEVGRINDIPMVYDGPVDEQPRATGDFERLVDTIDPFIGYERVGGKFDMQAGLTWDDLDFI